MFYVYILYSAQLDRYYIGFTAGAIETRLSKHLGQHMGFTGKATDWKLVYTEIFSTKQDATRREKQLKAWKSKARITQLIHRSSTE